MPMPAGRTRVVLVGAVAVLLAASAAVAVVERRQRRSLEARVERLEEQDREDAERSRRPAAPPSEPGGGEPEDLLGRVLDALEGGGASGALGGSVLRDCSEALAGRAGGGVAGLFGGGGEQPADPDQQLREVATAVEEIRGLRFRRLPEPVRLAPADLERRVRAEVDEELSAETAADEQRLFVALGALPPGADLKALTLQALGRQVAGFYDPETGELVVGAGGGALDGPARMVLAHELEHALADQTLDLPVPHDAPAPGTEDEALARLALVEGDATLTMQLYALGRVALLDQLGGLGGALAAEADLARLPHHLQRSLTFPYLAGLSFVCRIHADGGWAAVDRAYAAPPGTTAQVLFPDRFRSGEAATDPRDAPSPGPGWDPAPRRAFGAAELLWLLEAPGGDPDRALDDPLERVASWGGGEVHAWARGDATAVALVLAERAGGRLCDTVTAWYGAAFPDGPRTGQGDEALVRDGAGQDAVVRCPAGECGSGSGPTWPPPAPSPADAHAPDTDHLDAAAARRSAGGGSGPGEPGGRRRRGGRGPWGWRGISRHGRHGTPRNTTRSLMFFRRPSHALCLQ